MNRYIIKLSLVLALSLPMQAYADCLLNGKWYPEGTVINGRVCVDGEWQ